MTGSDLNSEEPGSCVAPNGWEHVALTGRVSSRSGDGKIIKGKQAEGPGGGLVQGFSASGPDVWVADAHYESDGVAVSAVGARCGKTFLARAPWTAIANTHALVPGDSIDVRFLWYLTNREDWWIKSGTAQPFVKVKDTLARRELIPPLAEQQRIVEILEEQFSRLDAALESVRIVREKAAQFRRSLLHAAFTGALTGHVVASGELPEGWKIVTLDDLVDEKASIVDGPFGSNLKSSHYTDRGARVVRLQNIGYGQFVPADAFISLEHFEKLSKHNVVGGDLLFASLGENLPRTCLAPFFDEPTIVKADCIRVRLSKSVNPNFVLYATQRPEAQKWASDQLHGMGRPRLGLSGIRGFSLPLPKMAEQNRIVEVLDEQFQKIGGALSVATAVEQRSTALRRSLLHAAFTGKLTEQWREEHAHV